MKATNLVTSENKNNMAYHMLGMVEKIDYLNSIETTMSMFIYETEEIETAVFAILLTECQLYNERLEATIK
jgi:hypothetical protein